MKKKLILILAGVMITHALQAQNKNLPNSIWSNSDSIVIFIFLGPECPISQQYTKRLNEIYEQYSNKGIQFKCIFGMSARHNQRYNKMLQKKIDQFINTYRLKSPIVIDKGFKQARMMQATVTPEVFIWTKSKGLIYHGAIDNWYFALGKTRYTITEYYLEDAIKAAINNTPLSRNYAEPVGCLLEYR